VGKKQLWEKSPSQEKTKIRSKNESAQKFSKPRTIESRIAIEEKWNAGSRVQLKS